VWNDPREKEKARQLRNCRDTVASPAMENATAQLYRHDRAAGWKEKGERAEARPPLIGTHDNSAARTGNSARAREFAEGEKPGSLKER
jgi:hypothetical protein